MYEQIDKNDGWIVALMDADMQLDDYWSFYITSIYFIIASFSSVGYGDVYGFTQMENLYQLMLEMLGIIIFGYMIGTFQQLLLTFQVKDQLDEQKESIDYWIMTLDKVLKKKQLPGSVFDGTQDFYSQKFRLDAVMVQETEVF